VTTIAVVEDNADNRLLLQALLADRYELVEFDNGADALAGLRARLPDLVLLDISLPGMDGNEILGRIRDDERLRPLPVIALTAHAMAGDREKYLNAGFDDYITKPIVDETLLIAAIERWLARR
jgi:two-component system cell cycle response regulator DivK